MKIISKSIRTAIELLPQTHTRKSMHFAFGFERNKLLAIGQNRYEYSADVLRIARRFNDRYRLAIPTKHAEIDLLSKMWGKYYIDKRIKIVVLRLSKRGRLINSKPCKSCQYILDAIGVTKIWYSRSDGEVVSL